MKALNIIALVLILGLSQEIFCQEIEIDLTFTSDTVIFPFESIETISELTMKGDIKLEEDTSLIRVILEDETGLQYMIFEAYPLICPTLEFSVEDHCDETCFLDQVNPYSIIIQISDATLDLASFNYTTEPKENCIEERYKAKRALDAEKITAMNQLIPEFEMNWAAGDNGLVAKYYEQKRHMFGDGYNLLGYEYYYDGVFEFLGHGIYPKVDPDLVKSFDWRSRHGANDSLSLYWDGDPNGTGWLTKEQSQLLCGSCWAFSAVGVVEAIANLYSARHINYDLSEQDLLSCSFAGTCEGGDEDSALIYIKYQGIVTENCFLYKGVDYTGIPCTSILKCNNPDTIIRITDTLYYRPPYGYNYDSIRIKLITKGPLTFNYEESPLEYHDVVLFGFEFVQQDSTLYWLIKNSNTDWGDNGFGKLKLENYKRAFALVPPIFHNDTALKVECHDYDLDGYCFWGIGDKPESCDSCDCSDIEDCNDNDSLVGGYDENFNCSCLLEMDTISHYITSDTNWSDTTYVNYEVIVDSGACLTISSYTAFAPDAIIIVKPGAKLLLDSAYLTKACPELWQGIDVLGSDTIQDFDEYFGKVVVRNNSIIEYAEVGIANHCRTCGYQDMQCGGIISAENSIFRDNERDILLNPFSTYWFNHDLPYACVITDCKFITTDNFYPEHLPVAHIEMKDIYGVMIYGCRFENQGDLDYNPFQIRGTGISAIDSYFMINRYCLTPEIWPCEDFDTCNFSRLEYGIKAMNSRSKRTLNIQGLQFDSNFVAISLSGLENASVLSNNIKCPKSIKVIPADRFTGGLFMEGCTGYHVENNEFNPRFTNMESGKSPCIGIGVKNSGPDDNEIYNNIFKRLSVGIYSIGENRGRESGLCLKCNDMIANKNDFFVVDENDPPLATYQGINRYQGDPLDSTSFSAPAGNTFTWFPIDSVANPIQLRNYNYLNDGEDFWYYHHLKQTIPKVTYPLDSNYTRETIELKEWTYLDYNKTTACPSGIGGGGPLKSYSSSRVTINEADIQLDILKTQLNELVDGGNTEVLNFEVMTSLPDEGLEIRQELLSTSPFLSDTVLKQAIYKEQVLPNAMIRDVMEANPQSAKSEEILSALDSRYEPMPDYMMAQIMQGKKYLGAKEVLEAKIQTWQKIRSKAKADLMRGFLLDTNMINPLDSVIAFLENETDLNSRYDLALTQWNNSEMEEAEITLNMMPLQFSLNENQSIIHENYLEYFGILQTLSDSNWQANQLASTSVSMLFSLKESGNSKINALARGLLVNGGFYKYIETIDFPDLTKSSKILPDQYKEISTATKEEKLWLFPNPAGDYVLACYELDSKYKAGEIHLVDLNGNLLRSYYINSGKDQMVIDLKAYPNGIYMISLNSRNQVIDSKKLSKGGY